MSRKIHDLENLQLFFNLTSDFILVKEYGCMYGLMNGADSDDAVSIQKMVTPKLVGTWLLRKFSNFQIFI